MSKGLEELKEAGLKGRTLTDLKNTDISGYIKWKARTTTEGYEIKGQYEPIIGRFVRWDIREATFKRDGKEETKHVFDYFLVQDGRERCLSSGAGSLKNAMANSGGLGKEVKINRVGEGYDTKYSVEVIGE